MEYHFEKLDVWQKSFTLAKSIYQKSSNFPKSQQFILTSQLQRAATSISLNIAEGTGRGHGKEFVQFLHVARGSLYETVTLLKLAHELGYMLRPELDGFLKLCETIFRLLNGLIKSLKVKG